MGNGNGEKKVGNDEVGVVKANLENGNDGDSGNVKANQGNGEGGNSGNEGDGGGKYAVDGGNSGVKEVNHGKGGDVNSNGQGYNLSGLDGDWLNILGLIVGGVTSGVTSAITIKMVSEVHDWLRNRNNIGKNNKVLTHPLLLNHGLKHGSAEYVVPMVQNYSMRNEYHVAVHIPGATCNSNPKTIAFIHRGVLHLLAFPSLGNVKCYSFHYPIPNTASLNLSLASLNIIGGLLLVTIPGLDLNKPPNEVMMEKVEMERGGGEDEDKEEEEVVGS